MPTNDIQLTAGIRNNLLLLQVTSEKIDRTQQRLATGNKINSAIDGAVAFFAAKGLNRRADDLSQLKDSIGQSISTIKAADTGVTAIEQMLDQAQGLITSAYGSLGKDQASVSLRKSLSEQFNNLLRQIDKLAGDAAYQGKNLLLGSGLRLDATSSSKSATNAITGVSNTRVTNVVSADNYVVDITGDGAISADASDIANAERDRGIQNLTIGGFASKTLGNFDPVVIKYSGGKGKDKVFTVTEGGVSVTKTFTLKQWADAKATGRLLNFDHQFASGTHINFNIDFDTIDDVPDTAGVGTSVIEKNVNISVATTNLNGVGQRIERSALNQSGQQKLANGENAWAFDSGTPRMTIDERTILQASAYTATVGTSYGRAASAIVGTPTIPTGLTSTGIANDFTYSLTASATAADFNFVTGTFASYTATLAGPNGGVTTTVSASGSYTFSAAADAGQNVTLNLQTAGFQGIVRAAASTVSEANATEQALGAALPGSGVALTGLSGLAHNLAHTLTFNVSTTGSASTFTLSDGYGGTATVTGTLGSQVLNFTVKGGVNNGATLQLTLTSGNLVANAESTLKYNAIGDFTAPDQALFDVRAANTGQTSTLNTVQVTDGNDSNNLTVQLNETNTSQVTVVSQNVQTDGQGLAVDFAQNQWRDRADIDFAAKSVEAAKLRLRAAASSLSNNLDIITTRLNYTNEFINVLAEGANKLVQADQNEEGANLLQLQTRQQLGTISLSLANQAQQAILRLF
ncbi:flagellin N-terminal helical domain-containing protein [Dongia deserti]|uniref:flagellin N-terminal helical domain-containing protein n=1 Tax=Dongia deserti TaxID=2268030 RepID=UPI000E65D56C|nr:flagellin [Dongia deserti]